MKTIMNNHEKPCACVSLHTSYHKIRQMSIKIELKMVRICVFLLINAQICSFLNLTSMFIEDYTASILISDKSVRAIAREMVK